ncbi:MAG: glutathione S-transferase family protein, partial [Nevskia sp.]|nr:glutathione S-transferase family protein [Nevskia sp.]
MKLYYFPLSTYSQKALIAFHEKQVPFEPVLVDLRDPQQRAQYQKTYPLGKVPLLVRDNGWMIPESTIIIEFLDTHSERGQRLIPADPERARQTRFMDRMMDLYLDNNVITLVFQSWKPPAQRDQEAIEQARRQIGITYDYMERALAGKPWLTGDEFSMADCAAAPALLYAQQHCPFADRPNISAYWERLRARPSYAKVLAEVMPYLEKLAAAANPKAA